MEGREKSVEMNNPMSSRSGMKVSTETDSKRSFHYKDMDHREWYWNSIDVMDLSPEQRKHVKKALRKEVRK